MAAGKEPALGHDYCASIFYFQCKLITGSAVGMYASERTFVVAVACQLEAVVGGGAR